MFQAAVGNDEVRTSNLTFAWRYTYYPCGVGHSDGPVAHQWSVPPLAIQSILRHRQVELLKLDIDSNEGALLHSCLTMLETRQAYVHSLLIEMGEEKSGLAWCDDPALALTHECRRRRERRNRSPPVQQDPALHPRGGLLRDLQRLQRLGYEIFRVNVHTGREIFDWRGENANTQHMVRLPPRKHPATPQPPVASSLLLACAQVPLASSYVPLRQVRGIQLLHWLPNTAEPWANSSEYRRLVQPCPGSPMPVYMS